LNIPVAHKAAIKDFSENIHTTQSEMDMASLEAAGKGPAIPFLPERIVEEQLASRSHRTWKIWTDIPDFEATACKEQALSCMGMFKEP
jgi:hypothetical protein